MAGDLTRGHDALQALVRHLQAENDQLRALLKGAVQQSFGARSERTCVVLGDQLCLDLGDLAPLSAANDDADHTAAASRLNRRRGKRGQVALPVHLDCIEQVIDPDSLECSCCAGALHRIGVEASEALDWVPAIVRVIRTLRPRYGCRRCREVVTQAPAPARAIPGLLVTTSTLAWMATARFACSIPLKRQLQMLAGQGVLLDRSVTSRWMRKVAWLVRPLYDLQLAYIHRQSRIFCDETRMPVQEKGRRRVRITQFWAHACDDRPWAGPAHPAVAYIHARGRGHDEARRQLALYSGTIQADGYAAYKALVRTGPGKDRIRLAFCLAHTRRKFIDAYRKSPSPIAARIIARIGEIYAIETRIRGLGADERRHIRQAEASPLFDRIKTEIDTMLPHLSPKSDLARALRYALGHWSGLTLVLEYGRLEVDTNTVERGMRSVAQGRKSSLFAGSEHGAQTWTILASLLQTARLNGLDPYTWLNDVLRRIASGEVKSNQLACLLPWSWGAAERTTKQLAA